MPAPLETLPDDPAALKAMIVAERAEADRMAASMRAYEALIQALKIHIARLRKQKFGPSSEEIAREIEQLQLALEDLEVARASPDQPPEPEAEARTAEAPMERTAPRRRGKPRIAETTLRERIVLDPGERCPDCSGVLRLVGEDVSEILDFIAAKLKGVETTRLKKSCRHWETIVPPAGTGRHGRTRPARPHPGGEVR